MSYSLRSLLRSFKVRANDLFAAKQPARKRAIRSNLGLTRLESREVPATIGDYVWFDANNDGIQVGEGGFPGVTVKLLDQNGAVKASTTTDDNGLYLFNKVPSGNYCVQVVLPFGGLAYSPQGKGGNGKLDSDVNQSTGITAKFFVSSEDVKTDIDAGLTKPTTADIGDFVWFDSNGNGLQDANEPGVPNVGVNLLDAGGNFLQFTKTDANGLYQFTNLQPATYKVQFLLPQGDAFTTANVNGNGNDTTDSDAGANGVTGSYTLQAGEINRSVDAGLVKVVIPQKGRLGDFVWIDTNCNGTQDKNEPGLSGVTVRLLNAGGSVIGTTSTDGNGFYLFDNLDAGTYAVQFELPSGYVFTKANVGNDNEDSDAVLVSGPSTYFSGVAGSNQSAIGRSQFINLAQGATNLSLDAGVLVLKDVSGYVYLDANSNCLYDGGDSPIGNVTIKFSGVDANGVSVNITGVTDGSGFYKVNNIVPGTYTIMEVQPKGYTDDCDSLGTPFAAQLGDDMFSSLLIDCGLENRHGVNYNFGESLISSIRGVVWYDANNNGIQDNNEPGIGGTRVTLTGTNIAGQQVNCVMFTGADGSYVFTGLKPGNYTVTESQPVLFQDGKDRTGSVGGNTFNDVTTNIQLPLGTDAFGYDFGEILTNNGKGNKEDLLASSKGTPIANLLDQSKFLPNNPTYCNSNAVTKLSSPSLYHFAATAQASGGSRVRVYDFTNGNTRFEFDAYPGFSGGVRIAIADVTGDQIPDIITAPGVGGGPHIKVFSGANGALVSQFWAFAPLFANGSYVAAGDLNGDGVSEIVTAVGEGAGPHVKVFNVNGTLQYEFFAYDPYVAAGIRLAVGDTNNDGRADIITVPGPGVGSHVKVFSGGSQTILNQFYAYGPFFTDGRMDIVTGAGSGGGPHVRVFKGGTNGQVINEWFAYSPNFLGGVRVGAVDMNGDGKADVLTAPGSGFTSMTQVRDVMRGAYLEAFLAYDASFLGGSFVTGGTRRNFADMVDC